MHCTMGEIRLSRKQPGTASACPCAYDREKRAPRGVVKARQAYAEQADAARSSATCIDDRVGGDDAVIPSVFTKCGHF